jgi:hypothetical protein
MLKEWMTARDWQARGEYAVPGSDDWTTHAIVGSIKPIFWNVRRLFVTSNSGAKPESCG